MDNNDVPFAKLHTNGEPVIERAANIAVIGPITGILGLEMSPGGLGSMSYLFSVIDGALAMSPGSIISHGRSSAIAVPGSSGGLFLNEDGKAIGMLRRGRKYSTLPPAIGDTPGDVLNRALLDTRFYASAGSYSALVPSEEIGNLLQQVVKPS